MTKRDLFRIIIKLFGLYSLLITVFTFIPNTFSNLFFQFDGVVLLIIMGSIIITIGVFVFLLFKTDAIINLLKLDKGFDEERIELGNLNNESIFKFAILLIGVFLMVDNIPQLLEILIKTFRNKASHQELNFEMSNYMGLFKSFVNVILGYLFISNYKFFSTFLDKK